MILKKKIKYQGAITKIICKKLADRHKVNFKNALNKGFKVNLNPTISNKYEFISLSGSSTFEEQVLSLFSYVKNVGTPSKWIIYSDGTLSAEQVHYLENLYEFTEVKNWDRHAKNEAHSEIQNYTDKFILGKKLQVILNHPYEGQTMFVDSDVVFYKRFRRFIESGIFDAGLWYKPDAIYLQAKILRRHSDDTLFDMNSGFFVINDSLRKHFIYEYFEKLQGIFNHFSEQSSLDYLFKKMHAHMLDPRVFIVDGSDQFDFQYNYSNKDIALRHFIGPIRHKMWQKGWRWHLK